MSRLGSLGERMYRGEVSYDFVGKRKRWFVLSLVITVAAIVGLITPGLRMGIEFSGGAVFTVQKNDQKISQEDARKAAEEITGHTAIVQKLGNDKLRVQMSELDTAEADHAKKEFAKDLGIKVEQVDAQVIGPSWGKEISRKAWQGLGIFLVLVVIYLAIAFEWRMALGALLALIHDLTITVGVYALVGFEVTPGTVIGLLTILGYSLYDTVVVFDTIKENTKNITSQSRFTYSEAANLGLNQTLIRSINTSIVALLPVGALLFVGGGLLGAGMLNDIALSLFIGLAAGAYSSIFIATPLMSWLKEQQPEMKDLARRVAARRASDRAKGKDQGDSQDGPAGELETISLAKGPEDAEPPTATAGVGPQRGQRRQPVNRGRSRNRPSGKRR
ncbi:preprotein translocase subunit SecF [Wenjunlia vitaminophila]|uniref:Protein-export membrane protein SecF n=1 Tax=Wenjunlia vitaminophila TaxID=76728 RepID=A0A0T6LWC2_WENVI|nr:protein translocase subunit SecF [Wenjunlia vitaminophila]KRV50357.1 preprotein translocase subunit SecF [Wenjunlia vitaminophila]